MDGTGADKWDIAAAARQDARTAAEDKEDDPGVDTADDAAEEDLRVAVHSGDERAADVDDGDAMDAAGDADIRAVEPPAAAAVLSAGGEKDIREGQRLR